MKLEEFQQLVDVQYQPSRSNQEPLSKDLLYQLLDIAHLAPSDRNLQPTHYFIVSDVALLDTKKQKRLLKAVLGQKEILTAGTLVIFCGDRKAASNNLEDVIDSGYESTRFTEADENKLRLYVKLNFDQGAFGITYLAKALFTPILRLFTPMPLLPAVHKRYWLTKQVMLSCANFILAAKAAKLICVPIQGFDESRIRKIFGIPCNFVVPIIVAVSKPKDVLKSVLEATCTCTCKLPLEEFVHYWGQT